MSKLGGCLVIAALFSVGCGPSASRGVDRGAAPDGATGVAEDAAVPCAPAPETCDGLDDDCDGAVDEGAGTAFFEDADGDGYGDEGAITIACEAPAGFVARGWDCDDACPTCHPGGTEVCDGRDQDCSGAVDEGVLVTFYGDADGDGYGVASITTSACTAPAGYAIEAGDCDDACAGCHPGGEEICDELDQDCDGDAIEDALRTSYFVDADGDGYAPGLVGTVRLCARPPGYTDRVPSPEATDCADGDARAFPGQTAFSTTPVAGETATIARWDFDCDGAASGQFGIGGSCDTSIACSGRVGVFVGTTRPSCGASALFQDSCGRVTEGSLLACRSGTSMHVQACR